MIKRGGRNFNADATFGVSINNTVEELFLLKNAYKAYIDATENRKYSDLRRIAKTLQKVEQEEINEEIKENVAKNEEVTRTKASSVDDIMQRMADEEEAGNYGRVVADDIGSEVIGEIYKIVRDGGMNKETAADAVKLAHSLEEANRYLSNDKQFMRSDIVNAMSNLIASETSNEEKMINSFKSAAYNNVKNEKNKMSNEEYFAKLKNAYAYEINKYFSKF